MPMCMAMRLLIVALAALALPASPASAAVLTDPGGEPTGGTWQRWVDEQPLWLPAEIGFVNGACPDAPGPDFAGCADARGVWVAVNLRYRAFARFALYHELGHVVDLEMTETGRQRVAEQLDWRHWHPERFANHWANCAEPDEVQTRLLRRLRPLCALLRAPAA